MPKVSVVIPTCNRPELLKKAIQSVLNQTYDDFEIIVVDDSGQRSAEGVAKNFANDKIKYIAHAQNRGGAAARNTGIKVAQGSYIAFLDDDDEWLAEKLKLQVEALDKSGAEVGFCFTAVINITEQGEVAGQVPAGIADYHLRALRTFKGFLTVTLMVKAPVFEQVGLFDERFPSHQEPELMIRVTKKFKGIGLNQPLVRVNMRPGHLQIGKDLSKRIAGREMILKKHQEEFRQYPAFLARHYFQLALFYRDSGQIKKARQNFKRAFLAKFNPRYLGHYSVSFLK